MELEESAHHRLRADIERYCDADNRPISFLFVLKLLIFYPGFQFVFIRRLQEAALNVPLLGKLIRRILWTGSCYIFGSELALGAEIGGGLYVPHPYGIVVGVSSIGRNVDLMQGVTIGKRRRESMDAPVIGDGCRVGAGAVILGNVTIGSNSEVGANSVVIRDLPPNCVAVGIPAQALKRKEYIDQKAPANY